MKSNGIENGERDRIVVAPARAPVANRKPRLESATVSRRSFLRLVGGVAAASLTGCAYKRCELASDTPIPDLIGHLNQNIDQITSWQCMNVNLKPRGGMMLTPSVSAKLVVERPHNFRLQATAVTVDVADLGSNDERFWFWVKNDEEPVILTARHDCLQAAQRQMPMPFEPDWLIEALGVIPIDEAEVEVEKHPTDPKRVFFRRKRKSPDGSHIELVSTVDTCQGVILEHSLVNRSGDIMALARLGEHERNGKGGPALPHTIELGWPQAKIGLSLRMGAIDINPQSMSQKVFEMPVIADCRVHDIGQETQQVEHTGKSKV